MPCNNCKKDLPIVNKKYGLCPNCNSLRLHNGKSIGERKTEQNLQYLERAKARFREKVSSETDIIEERNFIQRSSIHSKSKAAKPIKQQTSKEAIIKGKLSQIKQKIRLEAVQNNEYFCKGCGSGQVDLDISHILSVGQYKHLELIEENMQLLCRHDHVIWESGEIWEQMNLNCFTDNLIFIYGQEKQVFQRFLTRIEEYQKWLIPEKDQEKLAFINKLLVILESGININ